MRPGTASMHVLAAAGVCQYRQASAGTGRGRVHSHTAARPAAYPSMKNTHTRSRVRADTGGDAQSTIPSGAHGSTAASMYVTASHADIRMHSRRVNTDTETLWCDGCLFGTQNAVTVEASPASITLRRCRPTGHRRRGWLPRWWTPRTLACVRANALAGTLSRST